MFKNQMIGPVKVRPGRKEYLERRQGQAKREWCFAVLQNLILKLLILLIKLNSISMELPSGPIRGASDSSDNVPQQNLPVPLANKNQIQNSERVSHAPSINEKIRQSCKNEIIQVLPQRVRCIKVQYMLYKGWICSGSTAIQFSILIGLILIQYISSAVTILPLLAIVFLIFFLHPPLLILIRQIQATIRQCLVIEGVEQSLERREEIINDDSQIPTLPKINKEASKRDNTKTKKIQYPQKIVPELENTQQTIKKQTHSSLTPEQIKIVEEVCNIKHNLLLIFKVIQIIVEVALPSFCLYSSSDLGSARKIVAAMSIIAYLMAFASSIAFSVFFQENSRTRQELIKSSKQSSIECWMPPQPNTKISIEQNIQSKPQLFQPKPQERKETFSIDQNCRNLSKPFKPQVLMISPKQDLKLSVEKESATKLEIKRSVLKPSKIHEGKIRKNSEDIIADPPIQRRKVEINSKKIQYFEYCVSPSKSSAEEHEQKNMSNQINAQRRKIIMQRKEAEAKLLAQKIQARKNKAKSQTLVTAPVDLHNDHEEEKIDHFL